MPKVGIGTQQAQSPKATTAQIRKLLFMLDNAGMFKDVRGRDEKEMEMDSWVRRQLRKKWSFTAEDLTQAEVESLYERL